jgi:two-component system OmpR family response regulator
MSKAPKVETKRILVVDDRPSDSLLVKSYLEATGKYIVLEENHAPAALVAAEKFRPDLILLDVMMPDLDGVALAENLRSSPLLRLVPIVFLTALVTKTDIDAGARPVGRYPFLAKPFLLSDLSACVERQLAS